MDDRFLHTDINAPHAALIFEGGGMRNAYTAAVVTTLLENGINFPKAYGISAGSSHAADYIARDGRRAKATFVDSVETHKSGGVLSFLKGDGFFDTRYIFQELALKNADKNNEWTFNYAAFVDNPADVHIEAFGRDDGRTVAWTKGNMHNTYDVMVRVAASCSYPLFTPPTYVDGVAYVDGGMGSSHGICLDAAARDGFTRFFIVRTQPKAYRMPLLPARKRIAYRFAYRHYPKVYQALLRRPAQYNALLDKIDALSAEGVAYVFCPKTMPITYMTTDHNKLQHAYDLGRAQCQEELSAWEKWIKG